MLGAQRSRWLKSPHQLPTAPAYLKVQVLSDDGTVVLVQPPAPSAPLRVAAASLLPCWEGPSFANMCLMKVLNQPQILHNLVRRFGEGEVYTFIDRTLIFLNPYRPLPLYSAALMQQASSSAERGERDFPHLYAVVAEAYLDLRKGRNQVLVISGESGSGKTENTKHSLRMLDWLGGGEGAHGGSGVGAVIGACNYVLEVFGNAQTVKNDNSSRFGKYLRVQLGSRREVVGASIDCYLLEKSRVVSWGPLERTFHVFYLQPDPLLPLPDSNFPFSRQQLEAALNSIGFTPAEIQYIWNIMEVITRLRRVTFSDSERRMDESRACSVREREELRAVGGLLRMEEKELERFLLLEERVVMKERMEVVLSKPHCEDNRNTFCKSLYGEVFELLLRRMGKALRGEGHTSSVNILDIFGFQDFQNNGLQQLCINYANEALLKLYNDQLFHSELQMLEEDGISSDRLTLRPPDNRPLLAALTGKLSVFSILNDLTLPRQYTDTDMLEGIRHKLKDSPVVSFDPRFRSHFAIHHSHSLIRYRIDEFKVKNQDRVTDGIREMVGRVAGSQPSMKEKTVLLKFRSEMERLVEEIGSCEIRFVRCLKTNQQKSPQLVEHHYLLNQISYMGIFQTIEIRKNNFPFRETYHQFHSQYYRLFKTKNAPKAAVKQLLDALAPAHAFLLGKQRVYYNADLHEKLEHKLIETLELEMKKIMVIQRFYRRYKERKSILEHLKLTIGRIAACRRIPLLFVRAQLHPFRAVAKWAKAKYERRTASVNKIHQMLVKLRSNTLASAVLLLSRFSRVKQEAKVQAKVEVRQQIKSESKERVLPSLDDVKENSLLQTKQSKQTLPSERNTNSTPSHQAQILTQAHPFNRFNVKLYSTAKIDSSPNCQRLFQGNLELKLPESSVNPTIDKLRAILSQEDDANESMEFCPASGLCDFTEAEIPSAIMERMEQLQPRSHFDALLRTRTNFLGYKKSYEEILRFKGHSISQPLTHLGKEEELRAFETFRIVLRICREGHIRETIAQMQELLELCDSAPVESLNEVTIQILRQINSDFELCTARMCQLLVVFLHRFTPDRPFLEAVLFILLRLMKGEGAEGWVGQGCELLRYCIAKATRKLQYQYPTIGHLPTKYQIRALVGRKQLSVVVALPTGRSVIVNAESHQSLKEVKERALKKFGINLARFPVELFGFFEAATFNSEEIEETPLLESEPVWEVVAGWERLRRDYQQQGVAVSYRLMFKVKFAFSVTPQDEEGILLCYSQCLFDFLIGRLRFHSSRMFRLAAIAQLVDVRAQSEPSDFLLPSWFLREAGAETIRIRVGEEETSLRGSGAGTLALKYEFLETCSGSPLSMAAAIPTNQGIKLFLRPKRLFVTFEGEILKDYALRELVRWTGDGEKFEYEVVREGQRENRTHAVFTDHSAVILDFLSTMSKLKTYSHPALHKQL